MSIQMTGKIQGVENAINYQFNDHALVWEALQAAGSGVTSINGRPLTDGNKRLALLGDAIMNVALVEDWYEGLAPKGRATEIVQTVSSNSNLERIARLHGLDNFVNRNPAQGSYISTNVLTATLEAIIGAVYLDTGLDSVKRVMRTLGLVPT